MKLLTTLLTSAVLVLSASAHCGSCGPDSKDKAGKSCSCSEKCDDKKSGDKKKDKDCGCSEKCDKDSAEKVG